MLPPHGGAADGGMQPGAQDGGMQPGGQDGGMQPGGRDGGMQPGGQDGGMQPGGRDGGMQPGGRDGGMQPGGRDGGMQPGGTDGGMQPGLTDGGMHPGGLVASGGYGGSNGPLPIAAPLDSLPHVGHFPLVLGTQYTQRNWDPVLLAQVVLAEFGNTDWRRIELKPPSTEEKHLREQVQALLVARRLRAERMNEIVAQQADLCAYFAAMLLIGPQTHPHCWALVSSGMAVGHMVGMYFKWQFNRPRPVQVYPALLTAIPTPPHPSYPNNHAFQSLLIARSLALAAPALHDVLITLSDRIAENRLVAGVHFPSDKEPSVQLAQEVMPRLERGQMFRRLLRGAQQELAGLSLGAGPVLTPPAPPEAQPT